MYAITATVTHHTKDANMQRTQKVVQIPTFYLDENVQGIVSVEHAERIAKRIILPIELDYDSVEVNVTAVKL